MTKLLKHISKAMDGEHGDSPNEHSTCPFSEFCKIHLSPGELLRYSVVIALSIFMFLFVFSLFFPSLVNHPDLDVVHRLVDILHHALGGSMPPIPTNPANPAIN